MENYWEGYTSGKMQLDAALAECKNLLHQNYWDMSEKRFEELYKQEKKLEIEGVSAFLEEKGWETELVNDIPLYVKQEKVRIRREGKNR